MKDHTNAQRTARASSILLGALILAGMVMPIRADSKLSRGMDILASRITVATHGQVNTEVYLSADGLRDRG